MYGVVMAGLLFLAFAFFAVAQASTVRNGGQSAADSAAIGASQDDRDQLFDGFMDALDDGDAWKEWLAGEAPIEGDGCGEAEHFAGQNRSDVQGCDAITRNGDDGYTVDIQTQFDTGDTIVPGTDNKKAKATATAVVQPLCEPDEDEGGGGDEIHITCDGEDITIDPDDEDIDLEPADLFDVVLVD